MNLSKFSGNRLKKRKSAKKENWNRYIALAGLFQQTEILKASCHK
jgi:hypothetical protein